MLRPLVLYCIVVFLLRSPSIAQESLILPQLFAGEPSTNSETASPATPKQGPPQKPPLSLFRIAGEHVGGWVGGALGLGALFTLFLGQALSGDLDSSSGSSKLTRYVVWGGAYGLGHAYGIRWVGSKGNQTGSFGRTLLATWVGMGLTFAIVGDDIDHNQGLAAFLPTTPAVLVFNHSRRYEIRAESIEPKKENLGLKPARGIKLKLVNISF